MAKPHPAAVFIVLLVTRGLLKQAAKAALAEVSKGPEEDILVRDEVVGDFRIRVWEPPPRYREQDMPWWVVDDLDRVDQPVDPGARAWGDAPTVEQAYAAALAWIQANG